MICIIVAAAAVVTIWQWDNIKALRYALGTSEEELEQEMAATQQELDDAAKEYNVPEINLTDEELAALESGDMDLNSVVDRVLAAAGASSGASGSSDGSGGQGASGSGDTGSAGDDGSGTGDSGNTSAGQDAEVQRLITSLYVLRSSYSSRLSGLVSSAKSEFASLPAEQQTDTARTPDRGIQDLGGELAGEFLRCTGEQHLSAAQVPAQRAGAEHLGGRPDPERLSAGEDAGEGSVYVAAGIAAPQCRPEKNG